MSQVRGCEFPGNLFYHLDNNVWIERHGDGSVRLGMTAYTCALAGPVMAFTPKQVGRDVDRNKSCATVESDKWVGPLRTPFAGRILEVNETAVVNPAIINQDPYGDGWLIRLRPETWEPDQWELWTGIAAVHAFEQRMQQDGFGGC